MRLEVDSVRFEPFVVYFRLRAPVMLNHPWLHFDGVLAHLLRLERDGRAFYALPAKEVVRSSTQEIFQILRTTENVFHASVSFFSEPKRIGSAQYYKRFEENRCPARRKINLGSGRYRNWMLRGVVVAADHCYFYSCGKIDRIAQLLHHLPALGDNTRIGFGAIHSWHIERLPHDRSLVWQGRAMRPIPVRLLESYSEAVRLAWRPPYWGAESIDLCAPPETEVRLRGAVHRRAK